MLSLVTRVEVEALIKLFNNMECILSPYNLYFSNLAAYLRTVCLRVEITDSVLAMRFVKAQEKSVEYICFVRPTSFLILDDMRLLGMQK